MSDSIVCPRCRSRHGKILAKSPVENVWTIFSCPTCFYTWRSSEPAENTDPALYPAPFRLDPDAIAQFPVVPSVPPLRSRS
ncbi:non-oxidative hydroxyarylic acid decarboxylases subunit D [Telmatospirillum sp.]|uniref:non-oxidative hydroxyarylic acid decarboxylases subunit D n=1 Tax=Telmatospirillum sp. TaxID=2079197 RepID=UPI003865DBAF